VSGELVGRPVNVVLNPAQQSRFAALTGVDAYALDVNVTGWNKYVLLDTERVFLFPRAAENIEWFERELTAYEALARTGLTIVPRVIARWDEPGVYPFPFAACSRLPGHVPDAPEQLFDQLGRAIAQWHALDPPALPGARPPAHLNTPPQQWLRRALDPATSGDAATDAADRLERPDRASAWAEQLARAAQLDRVLVHGDIHEDQLLAHDGTLAGILDWETVRVDHPFWDFDFGEWGTGLWRRHRRDFTALRAEIWTPYAAARGMALDAQSLDTTFRIRHALQLLDDPGDPAIHGTIEEELSHL
jgi:aminoglycoside phosphotransferase (APT) family kinase protein